MKTDHEIAEEAKRLHPYNLDDNLNRINKIASKRRNFIEGAVWMREYATQCQQDNAERKYTKQEMIDFAFDTYCFISGIMKVPFNQISENKYHAENNFETYLLTTLNKQ